MTYLFLRSLVRRLDPVTTLDDIGLKTDGTRATMQLEEETAGVAEHRPRLVPSP